MANTAQSLQGQSLANGRFHLVNLLGSGGMADVYRAYDNRTDRDVAVKIPRAKYLADPDFVKRFEREIKIMLKLNHPHIVPVLFAGRDSGLLFAVFPYLVGGSLSDRKLNTPPTTTDQLTWMMQIAMALDHLHAQGLLHRDVKAGNILFDGDGTAYLADFGIVRALDSGDRADSATVLTAQNVVLGTVTHMAPELILGETPYTGSVDQYALAMTLYEALAGNRMFDGGSQQVMGKQLKAQPKQLPRSDMPTAVSAAVQRALSKDPQNRFPSCVAFAQTVLMSLANTFQQPKSEQDMETSREPSNTRTLRVNPLQPFADPPKPKPRQSMVGLAMLALTAILVAGVLFWLFRPPSPNQSSPAKKGVHAVKTESNFTNAVGMEFVLVPKGTFWMSGNDKNAQKQVTIEHSFYIGKYEVTQSQWQTVMGNNPSTYSRNGTSKTSVIGVPDDKLAKFPVENISWLDSQEFAAKLNNMENGDKWTYRLPTESEWEYACRGAAKTKAECSHDFYFEFGTDELAADQANFNGQIERPTSVGSFPPNRLGIFDMHGNVWEWCQDWYIVDSQRAARSGDFNVGAASCKTAYRAGGLPENGDPYSGLRLVRVPSNE